MSVKIMLDLQALERVIGEDSDIQLEIRNGVVQTFCSKYLKGLVTEDLKDSVIADLREWLKEYRAEIKKEIIDHYIKQQSNPVNKAAFSLSDKAKVELREEFRKIISDELFGSMKSELQQATSEYLAACETSKRNIASSADVIVKSMTEHFDMAIARAVESRLKKMLERGLISHGQS